LPTVNEDIKRPDPALIAKLGQYGVATVHEAQGRTGLLADYMRPVFQGARIAGPAVTVTVAPGDNWTIHVAIEQCQPGDVMVVAPTSPCNDGYFGDLLATLFQARGVRALIIDAGVRDTADLREMNFPVWSKCISAQGTVKETVGDVNLPIVCAGQAVDAGDAVLADDDGIVIVPRAKLQSVIDASAKRDEKEAGIRARYAKGELGLDMNNMRPRLAEKGLIYTGKND
jgi:4-hydroxy-4-methyl-2-oxoglutarate aldolase